MRVYVRSSRKENNRNKTASGYRRKDLCGSDLRVQRNDISVETAVPVLYGTTGKENANISIYTPNVAVCSHRGNDSVTNYEKM